MYSSHNQQSNSPNVTDYDLPIGGVEVASGMVVAVLVISTSLVWRRGRKRTANPFLSRVPLLKTKSDLSKNKARRFLQRLQEQWEVILALVKDRSQRFSLRKATGINGALEASSSADSSPTTATVKSEPHSRPQHRKTKVRLKAKQKKKNALAAGSVSKDGLNKAGGAPATKSVDALKSRRKQNSRSPLRFTSKKSKNIDKIVKNLSISWPEEKPIEHKRTEKVKSPMRSPSVQNGLVFMDAIPEVIQTRQSTTIKKSETKIPAADSCPDLKLKKAERPARQKLNCQPESVVPTVEPCTILRLQKCERPGILSRESKTRIPAVDFCPKLKLKETEEIGIRKLNCRDDHCYIPAVQTVSLEEHKFTEEPDNQLSTIAELQGDGGLSKSQPITRVTSPLVIKNIRHGRSKSCFQIKEIKLDPELEVLDKLPPICTEESTRFVKADISYATTDRQGDAGSTQSASGSEVKSALVSAVTVPVDVIKSPPRLEGIVTAPSSPTARTNSDETVVRKSVFRRTSLPIESETQLSLAARLQQLSLQIDVARTSSLRCELTANLQKQQILRARLQNRQQRITSMMNGQAGAPNIASPSVSEISAVSQVSLAPTFSPPYPLTNTPVPKFTCTAPAIATFPQPKTPPAPKTNILPKIQIPPENKSRALVLVRAPLSRTNSGNIPAQVTDPKAPKDDWKERLMNVLTTAANIAAVGPNVLPNLKVTPCDVACAVQTHMQESPKIKLIDIRLNGSVAVHIVAKKVEHRHMYNDVDLIFNVDIPAVQEAGDIQEANKILKKAFNSIRDSVRQILLERAQQTDLGHKFPKIWGDGQAPEVSMDLYIDKMVCVAELSTLDYVKNGSCKKQLPTECYWSLFSLRNSKGQNIEMKFVFRSGRSYQFATDAMQVILWPSKSSPKSKKPTQKSDLAVEASSGDFEDALYMLDNKLLRIHEPNNLRGGGFLQFCKLLMRGFKHKADSVAQASKLETAMLQQFLENNQMMESQFGSVLKFLQAHMSVGCSVDIAALEQLLGKGLSPGWRYNENQIRPDDKIVTKCCWNASAIFLEVITHVAERITTSQGQEDLLVVLANLRLIFHIYKVKHLASKELESVASFQAMIWEMMKGVPSRRALLKVHQSMKFRNFRRCMLEDAVRFLLVDVANHHCIKLPIENIVPPSLQTSLPVKNDLTPKNTSFASCKLN